MRSLLTLKVPTVAEASGIVAAPKTVFQEYLNGTGERRLTERVVTWPPDYEGAAPVHLGDAASNQIQLGVWGALVDMLHLTRAGSLASLPAGRGLQRSMLDHLATIWREPDEGIWEVHGCRCPVFHSEVLFRDAFERMARDNRPVPAPRPT